MEARVDEKYQYNRVRACAGVEFVKSEYRPVPPDREDEARDHVENGLLELKPEPEAKPKPRRRAKAKVEPKPEPEVEAELADSK